MKTKLTLLSVIAMTVIGLVGLTSRVSAQLVTGAEADEIMPVIDLQDTTIDAAIKGLADMAGLNVHLDPKITATPPGPDGKPKPLDKVSIRWRNISAKQALQALLDNNGYVATTDLKTKVTRISIKDPNAQEPLVPHVVRLKYGNVTNLMTLVKSSLSTRSQVYADPRSSQLVVLTTESEFNNLSNFLSRLDINVPQILIEARFYETLKNPKTVKGIDWSKTLEAQNITFGNGISSGQGTTITPGLSTTTGGGPNPGGGPTLGSSSGSSYSYSSTMQTLFGQGIGGLSVDTARGLHPATAFLNADGAKAVLSFLNTDNDTESLATPRAVTQEGIQTELSVVRNVPIFEEQQGAVSGGVVQQNTSKPNYDLKAGNVTLNEVGVKMLVTPRVVGENNVWLELRPEISQVEAQPYRTVLNGKINEAPVFARRKLTTQATVPDGNTLVLAGLVTDDKTQGYKKVPVLGDIPGFGLLFRHESKERSKRNLMIFVTPTIVRDGDFSLSNSREFLKSKVEETPDIEPTAWDSGKPASKYRPLF